jgi:membrane protein DedA with SNARE-associated domain
VGRRSVAFAAGFEQAVVDFLSRYGYVAYFVVLMLETAFIIHFVPGELIVSVASAQLATSPLSLAAVILVGTVASTAGCVLLYVIVRTSGTRFIDKHAGRHRHWLDRMQRIFERPTGEAMVFVFRMVPIGRGLITFPAALAKMDFRKFVAYSAAGNFLFVFAFAYVTYIAKRNDVVRDLARNATAYLGAHIAAVASIAIAVALLAFWVWRERKAIRETPHHVVARAWQGAAILALGAGLVLLAATFVLPDRTHDIVSNVLDDYTTWTAAHGLSDLVTLLLVALQLVGIGVAALALTNVVRTLAGRLRRRRAEP